MNNTKPLNSNILKLSALAFMTVDHIGYILLNNYLPFRIIGRLAFPIFAYMIAEGCAHTKNRRKYFLTVFLTGAFFQIIYSLITSSLSLNILLTFSVSIALIYIFDWARAVKIRIAYSVPCLVIISVFLISYILPPLTNGFFKFDYGFIGILIPVALYFTKNKKLRLAVLSVLLVFLSLGSSPIQFFSLLSVPMLALYNGNRGKHKLKYLFYIYYPAHLLLLYLIKFITEH